MLQQSKFVKAKGREWEGLEHTYFLVCRYLQISQDYSTEHILNCDYSLVPNLKIKLPQSVINFTPLTEK